MAAHGKGFIYNRRRMGEIQKWIEKVHLLALTKNPPVPVFSNSKPPSSTASYITWCMQQVHRHAYIKQHSSPYMALSTSFRTWYQSALRSAYSYTSSARKMPPKRSPSAMMVAISLACRASIK